MWKIIYRSISYILLIPALFFLLLSKKTGKSITQRLKPKLSSKTKRDTIWIHAASVGEAVIAISVVEFLSEKRDLGFAITTNTSYAKELLERQLGGRCEILYAPLDLDFAVDLFLKGQEFKALILIETEIWPNMIWQAKARGVPVLIVNGRISDRTLPLYRRISFFMKEVLGCVNLVLAQSDTHAERFALLGVPKEKIKVLGNIKYFRRFHSRYNVSRKGYMVTFGSIRNEEKDGLTEVMVSIKSLYPHLTFFVAPRELAALAEIEKDLKKRFRVVRFSFVKEKGDDLHNSDVILVDTVGELPKIYAQSLVAFVGGSLAPYGGHNILEPIFSGTPVLFGPHIENFREIATDIVSSGAGFMVRDYGELKGMIEKLLADDDLRNSTVRKGRTLLERKKEEVEKKMEVLLEFI